MLRGARTLAYLCDMSRVLRSVRLASDLPRDVFQQPAGIRHLGNPPSFDRVKKAFRPEQVSEFHCAVHAIRGTALFFSGSVTDCLLLSYDTENIVLSAILGVPSVTFPRYSFHAYSFAAFADSHILVRGGFFSLRGESSHRRPATGFSHIFSERQTAVIWVSDNRKLESGDIMSVADKSPREREDEDAGRIQMRVRFQEYFPLQVPGPRGVLSPA